MKPKETYHMDSNQRVRRGLDMRPIARPSPRPTHRHLRRPVDPRGHYNLGVCLDALGQRRSALGSFEQAFHLQPGMADAGANAAGLLIQGGEAERATELCYRVSVTVRWTPPQRSCPIMPKFEHE